MQDPQTEHLLTRPKVSVLMATYNGASFIRQSIGSLLAQTWRDFELIVVDDCSTDATPQVLASIDDPRLRVFRNEKNLGVVLSRNRCLAEARGEYVAMQDHDDLSRPTRLALQVAYLDSHPGVVLLGTAAHTLEAGVMAPPRRPLVSSPALLAWMLLVANPLICSSIMFRTAAARRLDEFMRPDYTYADDFDLYHRMLQFGAIARLDEPLTVYRLHQTNASRTHEDMMIDNAVRVLTPVYAQWFGAEAPATAALIQGHVSAFRAVPDLPTLRLLQRQLRHLTTSFCDRDGVSERDRALIFDQAEELWQRTVRIARRDGGLKVSEADRTLLQPFPLSPAQQWRDRLDRLPFQKTGRRLARTVLALPGRRQQLFATRRLNGVTMAPVPVDSSQPPTLFVVVDTEAEFDWNRSFGRTLTNVAATADLERGQAVFDRYALRPIYVVDYPIASNPDSVGHLRRILDRGGCEIGAHLHPWTTPPFDENTSERNSYPGNLPPDLELAKLRNLVQAIEDSFGLQPLFYKAGRYGFGPGTARNLRACGIKVDFSILPGADLRWKDGPDFRELAPVSYWAGDQDVLTVPMTRSVIGALPALGRLPERTAGMPLLRRVPLRPILAHTRLADTVTLTPEGVTTTEQIRLIRSLLGRGTRQFVLHFHSPSLQAGHTAYTPDEAAVKRFIGNLEDVCRFFFEDVGGLPGYPRDLLPIPG